MTAAHMMAERFLSLKRRLPDIVGDMIADEKATIEDLQTEQLWRGEDNKGDQIEPEYTAFTVEIKKEKNSPFDRVTLFDEGDFYKGMFLNGGANNVFSIGNKDKKAGKLLKKYGSHVLGLNDKSIQILIDDHIRPELSKRVLAELLK